MKANEYQEWTMSVAIYPGAGCGNDQEFNYLVNGLTSEAGEVSGKYAKYLRDGKLDIGGLIYELGDVCWMVARLADALGYDFEDILTINHAKLEDRKSRTMLQGSGDTR